MKKFEYKCVSIYGLGKATTARLNEYGREGWELVEVMGVWHYFKRELPDGGYEYGYNNNYNKQ